MPRPRKPFAAWIAVAIVCLAASPATRTAAIAAAAATLFEATPFVLAAALIPRGRLTPLLALLGCGCGRSGPGALGLPAFGICWLAFGPAVAIARAAAAVALRFAPRAFGRMGWMRVGLAWGRAIGGGGGRNPGVGAAARHPGATGPFRGIAARGGNGASCTNPGPEREVDDPDPLAELARLAPVALAGALLAEGSRALFRTGVDSVAMPPLGSGSLTPLGSALAAPATLLVELALGALLGLLLPCATGAVALAASQSSAAPAFAAGLLATAGVFGLPAPRKRIAPTSDLGSHARAARLGMLLLGIACGALAVRGPSGFVNPRFVVPLGAAGLAALILALRTRAPVTRARHAAAIPALLAAALAIGSPVPERAVARTTLDDPYPGEALHFIGALAGSGAGEPATLVRYTITCCRADAEARAVRLDRPLRGQTSGAWFAVDGRLALDSTGAFVLHVAKLTAIPPPADPFAYR